MSIKTGSFLEILWRISITISWERCNGKAMMWDFPLYAVDVFYYHLLIKEAVSVYSMAEYNQNGRDIKSRQCQREMLCSC